jgi:hypothetical protein
MHALLSLSPLVYFYYIIDPLIIYKTGGAVIEACVRDVGDLCTDVSV